jgi:dihydropteroate synthase
VLSFDSYMSTSRIYYTRRRALPLGQKTYIAGILNLTPDSFSDGGDYVHADEATLRFHEMVTQGADIIDIGGESTRPGHVPISAKEEISRVVPFIQQIRRHSEALISVDTSKAAVAAAALAAGADIINDVWGAQHDPEMAATIAAAGAACILMHNRPSSQAGQGDVVREVCAFLVASIARVRRAGVREDAILIDPGLGFGKTYAENWELMRRLPEVAALGYPLLLGASRKSMIARLLDLADPKDRLSGSLATTAWAIQAGVDFVRVHDVRENRECAAVIDHCARGPNA